MSVKWANRTLGLMFAIVVVAICYMAVDRAFAQLITPGGGGHTTVESCTQGFFSEEESVTTVSENFAFGFTSGKVILLPAAANTQDVCVDLLGGTAICPAADAAGDIRLKAGESWVLDGFGTASVSVIAASGTQAIRVVACH